MLGAVPRPGLERAQMLGRAGGNVRPCQWGDCPVTQNASPAGSRRAYQPLPGPILVAPSLTSRATSAGTSSAARSRCARVCSPRSSDPSRWYSSRMGPPGGYDLPPNSGRSEGVRPQPVAASQKRRSGSCNRSGESMQTCTRRLAWPSGQRTSPGTDRCGDPGTRQNGSPPGDAITCQSGVRAPAVAPSDWSRSRSASMSVTVKSRWTRGGPSTACTWTNDSPSGGSRLVNSG